MRSAKWFLLAGLLVLLDQVIKFFVVLYAPRGQWIFYVQNTGATFGLFAGANSVLAALSVVALFLLGYFLVRASGYEALGLSLVFAGVFGNFVDRLLRGFVVDMFRIGSFPVFNVADVLIVSGVLLLVLLEVPVVRKYLQNSSSRSSKSSK